MKREDLTRKILDKMTEPDIFPRDIAMAEIKRRLSEYDELVPEVARLEAINADLLAALERIKSRSLRHPDDTPEDKDKILRGIEDIARTAINGAKGIKE